MLIKTVIKKTRSFNSKLHGLDCCNCFGYKIFIEIIFLNKKNSSVFLLVPDERSCYRITGHFLLVNNTSQGAKPYCLPSQCKSIFFICKLITKILASSFFVLAHLITLLELLTQLFGRKLNILLVII